MSEKRPTASEIYDLLLTGRNKPEVVAAFFQRLRLANGSFKTTAAHRLDVLNQKILPLLPQLSRPLQILDMGVSSGITTLEWAEIMDEAKIDYQLTASDICLQAKLLELGGFFRVLTDGAGFPLQFELAATAIPNHCGKLWRHRLFYGGLVYFCWIIHKAIQGFAPKLYKQCLTLPLVDPRLGKQARIIMREADIFNLTSTIKYDVVRVCNILNYDYFDEKTLLKGLSSLGQCLKPGGLIMVGRNPGGGEVEATVYKIDADARWNTCLRIGNGSELELLVNRLGQGESFV